MLSLETEARPPACLLLGLSPLLWAPGVVLGWGTLSAPFFGGWKGNQDGRCELPDKPWVSDPAGFPEPDLDRQWQPLDDSHI